MTMLTTATFQAPTLFDTDKVKATQYKDALDTLLAYRDTLKTNYETARTRADELPNEIAALKNTLRETLLEVDKATIITGIETLETELESVNSVLALNTSALLTSAIETAGIYTLQAQAKAEHDRWFDEIHAYVKEIDSIYYETRQVINSLKNSNLYRVASENLDNIEATIRRGNI